ncbi:MAG: winged helix-turn-helix domain-containing protein [Alistipes shahii]
MLERIQERRPPARLSEEPFASGILRHVMRNGNFMVTEIAEATGYSLTTIAKYVAELQSDGMIAELERVSLRTKAAARRSATASTPTPTPCPGYRHENLRN